MIKEANTEGMALLFRFLVAQGMIGWFAEGFFDLK
jgi:hypothetical protein